MPASRREQMEQVLSDPIVPGVRDLALLAPEFLIRPRTVFILGGSLNDLGEPIASLQRVGFRCFVHVDLLRGLSTDNEGIRFLADYMGPTGIITTHAGVVQAAREVGMLTLLRIFALDSKGLTSGLAQARNANADAVEILPGVVPRAVKYVSERLRLPVIAGGLIVSVDDVREALEAGATAVSTSSPPLWTLPPTVRP